MSLSARGGPALPAAVLLGAGLFSACVVASWDKPLVGDMVPYLWWARSIVETGVPLTVFNPDDAPYPGNLHPPLYPYLVAASFQLFGDGVRSAVLVNLAAFVATLGLTFALARRLAGDLRAGWLSVLLLLVHPLAIQGTLLPDTDTSLVPLGMLAYVWLFLRLPAPLSAGSLGLLGLAFGLCLWTKFATPLILPAVTGLVVALRERPVTGLATGAATGALGLAFFVGTHALFARAAGLDVWAPMAWPLSKAGQDLSGNIHSWLTNILPTLKTDLLWYTPAFVVLVGLAFATRISRYLRERAGRDEDVVWLLGWLIYLIYTVVIPTDGRPRYKSITLVLFAIPVAGLLAGALDRIAWTRRSLALAGAATAVAGLYYGAQPELIGTATLMAGTATTGAKLTLLAVHVLPLGLTGLLTVGGRRPRAPAVALAGLVLFSGAAVAIDVKQARAPSPHNLFGIGLSGFTESVEFIRTHARRDDLLLSFLDLPYYTRNPFYKYAEVTVDRRYIDTDRLRELLGRRDVKYWVFETHRLRWPPEMYATPAVQALLAEEFCLLRRYGNYHVYGRQRAGLCAGRS